MTRAPKEIRLNHPVESDVCFYDKLTVASFDAIANFRTNSAEQVVLSLARVFGVPRRVIRHLHPEDAHRAGDLICAVLDKTARSLNSFE